MTDIYAELEKLLKTSGFFDENNTFDDVRGDLHYTDLWADYLWRNRVIDQEITDPTLPLLDKLQPAKILEIGNQYGRFSAKVVKVFEHLNLEYIGTDVNPKLHKYFGEWNIENPLLSTVKLISGKFNDNPQIPDNYFDLILTPIFGISDLPYQAIIPVLTSIKNKLTSDGHFIFSNYNLRDDQLKKIEITEKSQLRIFEVVVGANDKIVIETYKTLIRKNDHGIDIRKVSSFNRFTNDYKLLEREFFYNQTNYISNNNMEVLLDQAGFKIEDHTIVDNFIGYTVSAN